MIPRAFVLIIKYIGEPGKCNHDNVCHTCQSKKFLPAGFENENRLLFP